MSFFRRTFLRAAALAFLGEAAAHVYVLWDHYWGSGRFTLERLPLWADIYFAVVGGYGAIGMWRYATELRLKRCRTCLFYGFTALFLTVSVLLHLYIIFFDRDHSVLHVFAWWYSFIGLTYCLVFALYLQLGVKLLPPRPRE